MGNEDIKRLVENTMLAKGFRGTAEVQQDSDTATISFTPEGAGNLGIWVGGYIREDRAIYSLVSVAVSRFVGALAQTRT